MHTDELSHIHLPRPPDPYAKAHAASTQNVHGARTERPGGRGTARQCPLHLPRRGCQASRAASAAPRRTAAATAMAELRPDCAHGAEDGRESVRAVALTATRAACGGWFGMFEGVFERSRRRRHTCCCCTLLRRAHLAALARHRNWQPVTCQVEVVRSGKAVWA